MSRIVTQTPVQEIPVTGRGGATVRARFVIASDVVRELGQTVRGDISLSKALAVIRNITKRLDTEIWQIISEAVATEYRKSGLAVKSGNLWDAATKDFKVTFEVRLSGGGIQVLIIAKWLGSGLAYFFAHLFGVITRPHVIKPKPGRGPLRWVDKTGKVRYAWFVNHPGSKIPRRNFIRFSGRARVQIAAKIRTMILDELRFRKQARRETTKLREIRRREKVSRERRRFAERMARERVGAQRATAFRVRKGLRKAGLGASQARALATQIETLGIKESSVEDIIKLLTAGGGIITLEPPTMRLG